MKKTKKPKLGRSALPNVERKKAFTFMTYVDELEELIRIAARNGISCSALFRAILSEWLQNNYGRELNFKKFKRLAELKEEQEKKN